jgi:hypothetical protein
MYSFDTAELRQILSGDFRFGKCLECDGKGLVWCDGDIGEVVSGSMDADDPYRYYQDCCDFCDGLGGFLVIGANG